MQSEMLTPKQAYVDDSKLISETNESNNTLSKALTL
jgi:hypothetical protein